jgi:NitT/TauT family transport system ATP-binding protein
MTPYEVRENVLRIEAVSLNWGGHQILKNVDLVIKDIVGHGQVVGLVGPSGMGKSQLFRIMSGLDRPQPGREVSGKVLLNSTGQEVRAGMVGVVPQDSRLFRHRTVLGNLLVAGRQLKPRWRDLIRGKKPGPNPLTGDEPLNEKTIRERANWYLEFLGLFEHRHKYPKQLSGGQRQRVAIAQQLMCSEHFLLMDEPFSGLDHRAKLDVCELVAQVAALHELNTIVVTTHDIKTAALIADRVVILGRDRDTEGNIIPGAHFVFDYDLAAMGLAWQKREEIESSPAFLEFVQSIEKKFEKREL